jgi:hypothetical protein
MREDLTDELGASEPPSAPPYGKQDGYRATLNCDRDLLAGLNPLEQRPRVVS